MRNENISPELRKFYQSLPPVRTKVKLYHNDHGTKIVDRDKVDAMVKDGWVDSKSKLRAKVVMTDTVEHMTRDQMIEYCAKKFITIDKRWSDDRIRQAIAG